MEFNIENLVRDNIKKMTPYSSARHEFSGDATIFLDANENSFGSPLTENYNRYPDPIQSKLKEKISSIKGVPSQNIFLGNGSDEAIDLLFRIFCNPGKDNVIIFPPTYGMYEVCAAMNDVQVKKVPLLENFQLNLERIETAIYAKQKTFIPELTEYPNLVILQTLSKAWGLAGLRLGMAFAGQPIINYLNKIKYPYNINTATQQLAIEALGNISSVNNWTKTTVEQKEWLQQELLRLPFTQTVYPSDANFILTKMSGASAIYSYLADKGIIVR